MTTRFATALAALLLATAGTCQVTVRDTIVPLPGISFCQDGATHRTKCTNLRLRPGALASLVPFESLPLEITGTPGAVTCQFVTVQSVTVLANTQVSLAATTPPTMQVDFLGDGPAGDLYLLFLAAGLSSAPTTNPLFAGPVHLDLGVSWYVGLYVPLGATTPYFTIAFPATPAAQGFDFFAQAVAVHTAALPETTVVDCFRF